jgi:hypothetical protein
MLSPRRVESLRTASEKTDIDYLLAALATVGVSEASRLEEALRPLS